VAPLIAAFVAPASTDIATVASLAIAGLVGLAVGLEREWSGHASGPQGRFAGIRTFFLLGLLGGTAGLFLTWGLSVIAAVILAGGALFIAAAYAMAVRRPGSDLDGTTEGAALVVLALGTLAGVGQTALAGGVAAIVVLALGEKRRVHWFVSQIGEREMRAAAEFLVLALVVLPLLPAGPFGPFGGIRPRALWTIVLLFSGINFAGYIARRAVGPERGYGVLGLLGGIISSTAITLQFARTSRREPAHGVGLALGVLAACTVLIPRVAVLSLALNAPVALALLPYLVLPLVVGLGVLVLAVRRNTLSTVKDTEPTTQSPLRLWSAIQMAVAFQVAITVLSLVEERWGSSGVLASAVALGLTDMDALTVSMNRLGTSPEVISLAARGIAVGLLSNTVFKLTVAAVLGGGTFRKAAVAGLAVLALAIVGGLWVGSRM
jgi:uncharacterized membrane protein (DUF4010 family)